MSKLRFMPLVLPATIFVVVIVSLLISGSIFIIGAFGAATGYGLGWLFDLVVGTEGTQVTLGYIGLYLFAIFGLFVGIGVSSAFSEAWTSEDKEEKKNSEES